MKKLIVLILFILSVTIFSAVKQKDLDHFNNVIGNRQKIFYLILDEYEGNKMCEYILQDVIMTSISEKLEKYMETNQLQNEPTFVNLLNLFNKYSEETFEIAIEYMYTYDKEKAEIYTANSYLVKEYFNENCYQPSNSLINKIEKLTN